MKITCFLLMLNLSIFAQQSFEVNYGVVFEFSENDKKNSHINPMLEMAKMAENEIKFMLQYKNGKTIFVKPNTGIKSDEYEIASAFVDADNIYYTDIINRTSYIEITENDLFKKNEFIVLDSLKLKWNLIDSTKIINNFKCFYANTILNKNQYNTNNDVLVEAWYTPEIPVSSGPKNFNGLPGLILYLRINKTIFKAEKINFVKNDNEINLPVKGEMISNEKYYTIFRERASKASLSRGY